MDAELVRFALAVLAFVLFKALIDLLVTDANAKKLFTVLLLVGCILYALFGSFLPW